MSDIMMHRKHMSSSVPVHFARQINVKNASNYHLDLVKNPENVYAVHLCIDSHNLHGYWKGFLCPLTHFVNAVIPTPRLQRYDVVTIFRSSHLFLVTRATFCDSHSW